METIKNYLEAMFANMPNTPEVRKAKKELYQMMEDKYTELIAEGKSENEAVGTVISNFGNLEELAEDLGLREAVEEERENTIENPRTRISMDQAIDYINAQQKSAFMVASAVAIFILCVVPTMLSEVFNFSETIGVILMFALIVIGVALCITNGFKVDEWRFIKSTPCQIDIMTADYVFAERKRASATYAFQVSLGTILCIICWIPAMILDEFIPQSDFISGILLFVIVAIGVFLLVYANIKNGAYETLLAVNDKKTISGQYASKEGIYVYQNDTIATIMSVYWPTITVVYLVWSFLTFDWHISWIIWPIASVVARLINSNCTVQE